MHTRPLVRLGWGRVRISRDLKMSEGSLSRIDATDEELVANNVMH